MYLFLTLAVLASVIYLLAKGLFKGVKGIFGEVAGDTLVEIGNITDENNNEENSEKISENSSGKPIKVEIKDSQVDASKIVEYQGEDIKGFEFRPQNWKQFISQNEAKEQAKTVMKKAKRGIRCHFLLSAIKGHGKTTFVELFAKSLGAKLIQRVGKQIEEDELVNIINEINTSKEKYVVFFIDEFDSMDWKIIKILNPIIEQFKISGKKIKPFIFAGATINKHLLIKTNPDTLDRIPHHIQFVRYSAEDIETILRQYKEQLYAEENVSDEVIKTISENCKFNPRTSISLLEDYIVEQNIKTILKNRHILKGGLDNIDVKLLDILNQSKKPMGCNSLSMRAGLGQNQYLREYEPFLVEFGYIERVPSRRITSKGRNILKEI